MSNPWTTSASATLGGDRDSVTLVEGQAFAISLPSGDMEPGFPHGLFYRDTRFLSEFRLRLNDQWPEPLRSTATEPFSAAFVLQEPPRVGQADSHVLLVRKRYVGRGMRENIVVHNYSPEATRCRLELLLDVDFADLFDVKEGKLKRLGTVSSHVDGQRVTWTYVRGEFSRAAHVDFDQAPKQVSPKRAEFRMVVPPNGTWELCVQLTPVIESTVVSPRYRCDEPEPVEQAIPALRLEEWNERLARVRSGDRRFKALLDRSFTDLAALRLFDYQHPDRTVVAAGAPWFMTLFGRDSLLTSWMAMLVDTDLALGTLQTLADNQGRHENPITEEEPGRILHEMRFGEATERALGGSVYYGSVDATPLFVMLLGELRRWGNRRGEVDALLPAADRAIDWIQRNMDRHGGYVRYKRTSEQGLRNQGWKDSEHAVVFTTGTPAEPPIALCEVQGYAYAACIAAGHFASELGDTVKARALYERAVDLKRRFNEDFWIDELDYLAMGLDRDDRQIDALASNMGHCLWTGILDEDKAEIVGKLLVSDELFSGWGIRTLGSKTGGYNPISYHNGSVWPHDNAICVAGLMRYGLVEQAHDVIEGIVAAADFFDDRLPELFAGLSRKETTTTESSNDALRFPVNYPTACSPQAWAAASPLLLLRAMLRFDPDVRRGALYLAPEVPDWIGELVLDGVPLAGARLRIEVERKEITVHNKPDALRIETRARPPLFVRDPLNSDANARRGSA